MQDFFASDDAPRQLLDRLEEMNATNIDLKKQIEEMNATNIDLNKQMDQLKSRVDLLEADNDSLQGRIHDLWKANCAQLSFCDTQITDKDQLISQLRAEQDGRNVADSQPGWNTTTLPNRTYRSFPISAVDPTENNWSRPGLCHTKRVGNAPLSTFIQEKILPFVSKIGYCPLSELVHGIIGVTRSI